MSIYINKESQIHSKNEKYGIGLSKSSDGTIWGSILDSSRFTESEIALLRSLSKSPIQTINSNLLKDCEKEALRSIVCKTLKELADAAAKINVSVLIHNFCRDLNVTEHIF